MPKKIFKKRRWRAKVKAGHGDKGGPSFSSKIISTDGIICLILGIVCLIMFAEYIAETIPKIAVGVNLVSLLIYMGLYAYGIFIGMV